MRAVRRVAAGLTITALVAILALAMAALLRARPQDLPWTPLDLGDTPGLFTAAKIAALGDDLPACRAALDRAGIRYTPLPERHQGTSCGFADGIRFAPGGSRTIGFEPAGLGTACPVAAALALWEWSVVQPAAERRFGQRAVRIAHFGSFSCRRLYGRGSGNWSEHATADAIDIAGFELDDGRRITVADAWRGEGESAAFLREVRDGACRIFSTTLSPDYNAAHADHLHLDMATRGRLGGSVCR